MHALDLLSDPQTLDVWLRWTLSMEYDQGGTSFAPMGTQAANKNLSLQGDARKIADLPYKAQSFRVQHATWWALPAYDKATNDKRELQGEIHVAPTIHPTTHLGRFHFWVRLLASVHTHLYLTLHLAYYLHVCPKDRWIFP